MAIPNKLSLTRNHLTAGLPFLLVIPLGFIASSLWTSAAPSMEEQVAIGFSGLVIVGLSRQLWVSAKQNDESMRLRKIVEDSDAAFMMVDRNFMVTYVNQSTRKLLAKYQDVFREQWPGFDAESILGQCIDQFHETPSRQRKLLADPTNLPFKTDIHVGPLTIALNVSAVLDAAGHYVGNALEWKDVTEERAKEERDADYRGQIDAIDKSQAVIEFTMDGTITQANDNLLKVMGYRLDEIVGKHHRLFVESEFTKSSEYREMWEKLGRGEYVAGEFKRIANGGRVVWLQASYNPIFDRDGQLTKVVKFARDITAAKELELKVQADQQEQARKVAQLLGAVEKVAAGDLSVKLPDLGNDSIGQVSDGVRSAVEAIRSTLARVTQVAASVASSAKEMASTSEHISSGAQEQASSLEETAASLEEITSAVKQNTDNSQQAQQLSISSREVAESGGAVVSNAVDAMSAINNSSKKIAEIITTIDEIAFQTNLLALNAAVEAARAGEQGRGFAVVASEVRNLAQRSAGAAKEIKNLIQDSVAKVDNGTELVNKSGDTLQEIVTSVKRVADIVTEISAASTEQLTGIEQVNSAVSQMDRVTQTNAAQTEEMTASSQNLLTQSENLRKLVSSFQLGEGITDPMQSEPPVESSSNTQWNDSPIGCADDAPLQDLDMVGVGADADFEEF